MFHSIDLGWETLL